MAGVAAMADRTTLMESEAGEAAEAVARMLDANRAAFARIAARLIAQPPEVVITCARGSSDHAATYAKYLIETRTGVPVVSDCPDSFLLSLPREPKRCSCSFLTKTSMKIGTTVRDSK